MKMTNTRTRMAALAICLATAGALADDGESRASKFVMSAVEDSAAGSKVLAGEYSSAVEDIEKNVRFMGDKYAKATNLCVSLTLSKQFDKAEVSCQSALQQSQKSAYRTSVTNNGRINADIQRAVALSNFGVLKVLSGDLDAGQSLFEKAEKITREIENPTLNLKHLKNVRNRTATP